MRGGAARSPATGVSATLSPIAPIAVRGSASSTAIPYDRATTTMAAFALCDALSRRIPRPGGSPLSRRADRLPGLRPECGIWSRSVTAAAATHCRIDAVDGAADLIRRGEIIAIKGTRRLSAWLRRHECRRRCAAAAREAPRRQAVCADGARPRSHSSLLRGQRRGRARSSRACRRRSCCCARTVPTAVPDTIAPGLGRLASCCRRRRFICSDAEISPRPLVMTSGNLSDEPQSSMTSRRARQLAGIAPLCAHARSRDREPGRRFGRADHGRQSPACCAAPAASHPSPIGFPPGSSARRNFWRWAANSRRHSAWSRMAKRSCRSIRATLKTRATFDDYRNNLALYGELFDHAPAAIIVDRHPDYLSSKFGRAEAQRRALPLDRGAAPSRPCRRLPGRERISARCAGRPRHRARRAWAWATTARSGAANSCWPTIAATSGLPPSSRLRCQAVRRPRASRGATCTRISNAAIGWDALTARHSGLELHALSQRQAARAARCR